MFAPPLKELPRASVRRILILRTAASPQVQWAVEQLKGAYPEAQFWVLGTQLKQSLFESMQKMEISQPWLNPRSCKEFRHALAEADFDLAVMCLNSDVWAGYEAVSRVMERVPARLKLVAGYTREWYCWRHRLFKEGNWVLRWVVGAFEFVLLPLVFLTVAAMPSRNTYMPAGQGRAAPNYDR